MRLRTKLLLAFLVPALFPLVPSAFATLQLAELGDDVKGLERTTLTEDLRAQIHFEIDLIPDPTRLSKLQGVGDLVHADHARLICRTLAKRATKQESIAAIQSAEAAIESYARAGRKLIDEARKNADAMLSPEGIEAQQAFDVLHGDVAMRGTGSHGGFNALVLEPVASEAHDLVSSVATRSEERASTATLVTTTVGLSAIVLVAFAASILFAMFAARPVLELLRAIRRVSHGDLDVSVRVRGGDEMAELATGFNAMVADLRRLTGHLNDLVDQKTEELRRQEVELERARKLAAVGRLAAGVAHEVNNPLGVIVGAAEGLKDRMQESPTLAKTPGLEDFPEYLSKIESEAFRLKKLVRSLLDFARPSKDGGEGAIARAPLDLVEVARDAVAFVRLDARAKENPIDASGLEGKKLALEGDADRLKEVILNLLFNALDATKKGGRVSVSARTDAGRAIVAVTDSGEGIASEDLERLFEPFFTTKPPGEGTGLGLALAYGIAERHGGEIVAKSEGKGTGATFELSIPMKEEPPPRRGTARLGGPRGDTSEVQSKGATPR